MKASIPAYIAVDAFNLTTDYSSEGSNSQNITDAWIFINDNLLGVYPIPFEVPVLKEGSFNLKIFSGVKANGMASARDRYLFYNAHEEQVTFNKGETLKIDPQITYSSESKFAWMEDFDEANLSFTYAVGSDTVIEKSTDDVFEGTYSGKVHMTSEMDYFEMQSPSFTDLPLNKTPVYLEVNFKTNTPVLVALYTDTEQLPLVYLATTDIWKKIYINLDDAMNSNVYSTTFKVSFGVLRSGDTPSSPEFYFDNIKLVHF